MTPAEAYDLLEEALFDSKLWSGRTECYACGCEVDLDDLEKWAHGLDCVIGRSVPAMIWLKTKVDDDAALDALDA